MREILRASESSESCNTKIEDSRYNKDNQCISWFFTWNNYNLLDVENFESKFCKISCKSFIFQEELGEKEGTIHIQGSLHFKGRGMRFSQLKKLYPAIHWEKTKCSKAADKYCCKASTRNGKIWQFPEPEPELECLKEEELFPWQKAIIDHCLPKPNPREINWVYDPIGNHGKSELCRYMLIKHKAIVCTGGSAKDIANLVKNIYDNGRSMRQITIFLFDVPRCNDGNVSYKALEEIKNGLITNTKYESGTIVFNKPHLWIFSNELPDYSKMSKDRWVTWAIDDKKDLIKYVNPLDN